MTPSAIRELSTDERRQLLAHFASERYGKRWPSQLARDFGYSTRTPTTWMTTSEPPVEMVLALAQLAQPQSPRTALAETAQTLSQLSDRLGAVATALAGLL
jgi:hypothetical protein